MKPALLTRLSPLVLFATLALSGCSGGSGTAGSVPGTSGDFLVLSTEPQNNGQLFLNEPIRIDFSNPVDLSSADLNTFSFTVFDQNGRPLSEQPAGTFALDRSPGDEQPGRRLLFIPRLPTNNTFDNGGFRPGRRYVVSLVGGNRRNGTVLRDTRGQGLRSPASFQFSTADGTTPAQLFRDTRLGGPRLLPQPDGFRISPDTGLQQVTLNKFGDVGVEVRLTFDQPLNPHSDNVPVALDTDPTVRSLNDRGRIFLEYDDPERGRNTWIPADVFLEVNTLTRAVVLLRPVGVLPNNAEVRVIALDTLEDISGESNVANAAYSAVVGTFRTESGYEPQFDAIVEQFDSNRLIDFDAPFLEPVGDWTNGLIRSNFSFQGTPTILDYEPRTTEVVLNTNFTQIVPASGPPFNVSGGVFNFRNVNINQGVRVIGQGTRPMVWLVSGDFRVAGELSVRGGDGDRVNVLNSANFPAAGGVGVCGGGNGGRGSPNSTARSFAGETGFGPGQVVGRGGRGGNLDCTRCGIGSGGGGGSLATQGDPWYKQQAGQGTSFQQQVGVGGQGCSGASGSATRSLAGGEAGPVAFLDARADNNFWGSGVNVFRQIRIVGELQNPIGGSGGGGGGDRSVNCNPNDLNFANDDKGGGGGGGGGVLIVQALGSIIVESSGRITADGGHGGGGEQAGSCDEAGGGGAGSGGMVILMSARSIDINVKTGGTGTSPPFTYANNDYDFSISADGGVCLTGTFGAPVVAGKYPRTGATVLPGNQYDARPLGALGGMGVVQLMAPTGNNADNTNTVLDDGINVFRTGQPLSGMEKQRMLAWRGFPDAAGQFVDDFGMPTNIGNDEGDIRPTPILLQVPYAAESRLRSKWLDTGASVRRRLTAPDGAPRGIVIDPVNNLIEGPQYTFAGTQNTPTNANTHGFVEFSQAGSSVQISYPAVLPSPAMILNRNTSASYQGEPAYRIELTTAALGSIVNRYAQYEAEFLNAQGTVLGSFRILQHSDRVMLLSPESGALPTDADRVQIRAKFFRIVTGGAEGLGPTYIAPDSTRQPVANVRIGFAFHKDATQALTQGMDPNRLPNQVGEYLFDLTDSNRIEEVRAFGAAFVQWDILFDVTYQRDANDPVPPLSPSSPRPEVHFLRLPMRF